MEHTPESLLRELVQLWDAGIRPQVVKGMLSEEQDFAAVVRDARAILEKIEKEG